MTTAPSRTCTRALIAALAGATALAAAAFTPILEASATAETPALTTASVQRHHHESHRVVHHDARGDVVLFNEKTEKRAPAPDDRATDITTTLVDHRAHRLVVHTRVRHLSRAGYRFLISEIRTSDGRHYELDLDYSAHPIGARVSLVRSPGTDVRCPGASWAINRSANRVDASIPSSCLGDPRWVRVGVAMVGAPLDLETSWGDDSRAEGRIGDRHLKLGPRQPRA